MHSGELKLITNFFIEVAFEIKRLSTSFMIYLRMISYSIYLEFPSYSSTCKLEGAKRVRADILLHFFVHSFSNLVNYEVYHLYI